MASKTVGYLLILELELAHARSRASFHPSVPRYLVIKLVDLVLGLSFPLKSVRTGPGRHPVCQAHQAVSLVFHYTSRLEHQSRYQHQPSRMHHRIRLLAQSISGMDGRTRVILPLRMFPLTVVIIRIHGARQILRILDARRAFRRENRRIRLIFGRVRRLLPPSARSLRNPDHEAVI